MSETDFEIESAIGYKFQFLNLCFILTRAEMKGTTHSALCLWLSPPLCQCNGQARHMGAS